MRLSHRKWAGLVVLGTLLAWVGATAPAAAALATLNLSTGAARPGATVTFTGASFAVPRVGSGVDATPVVVHWQGEGGQVIAEAVPDRLGAIVASFTVPEVRPGIYIIVATQKTARLIPGAPPEQPPMLFAEPGTPARASFEVLAPGARPTLRNSSFDPVDGPEVQGQLDSTVWIVLTAAFGAVALSLFGGGLIAFIHQSRKAREPASTRWVPPGWNS